MILYHDMNSDSMDFVSLAQIGVPIDFNTT